VLYAMAAGRPAFRGESSQAVILHVCNFEPPPLRALNAEVPAWLEGIIRKLHAKNAADRFESAAEVAELLEACLAHVQQPDRHRLPARAIELGRLVPGSTQPGQRRWRPALLVLAVAVGAALLLLLPRPQGEHKTLPPGPPRQTAESAQANWQRVTEETNRVRTQLEAMRQSFYPRTVEPGSDVEATFVGMRQDAERLQRDLEETAQLVPDPVDDELQSIEQRLHVILESMRRFPW
jgi:hypothetical protein